MQTVICSLELHQNSRLRFEQVNLARTISPTLPSPYKAVPMLKTFFVHATLVSYVAFVLPF